MGSIPGLKERCRSIEIPPEVPVKAIMGLRGTILRKIKQSTATKVLYNEESHRFYIYGHPKNTGVAANLIQRTVEHYQYSGLQFARKVALNILDPELTNTTSVQLLRVSRPVRAAAGSPDIFVLEPTSPATSRQQPGASTSSPIPGTGPPLLRPANELDAALDELLDVSTTIAMRHPASCDKLEIRVYLGKMVLTDVSTSLRSLAPSQLTEWTYPLSGRAVFDTAVAPESVRSLDTYLSSIGLTPTQQSKSVSVHLETSIPWIQYHPTFAILPDGSMQLAKLETLGCKPLTVAMVGPANTPDVRIRFVASVQYGNHQDIVAEEIRRRESEFSMLNNVQVQVPPDLHTLDLALASARVKLKRVYTCAQPLPPLPPAAATTTSNGSTSTRRFERGGTFTTASRPEDDLPPVSLKVSVAAVVDNAGDKRLEVTVNCPEINNTLMELHRRREEEFPGAAREVLAAQLRSFMAHVQALRRNVRFEQ